MSTKVLSALALAATVCFLLLITFQVIEMRKYSSSPAPAAASSTAAATAPEAAPAETPAAAAQ